MLMRYGQTALLAVLATLMGNVVWAQQPCATFMPYGYGKSCNAKGCCATGACCKDGKCCKGNKCGKTACGTCDRNCDVIGIGVTCPAQKQKCGEGKPCNAMGACRKDGQNGCINYFYEIVKSKDGKCVGLVGACCKESKCECGKGGDCCCKDGKCGCKGNKCECGKSGDCCCKGKTSVTKKGCGCPYLSKLAKSTAIIMVMPSSLPLLGACPPAAMGMMPHPPMPMGPHAMLPMPMPLPPPPPMLAPPGLPMMPGMIPPSTVAMPAAPCCPCPSVSCGLTSSIVANGQPTIEACDAPAVAAKVHIIAVPSSTDLEMNVGDDTCVRCKKMAVKIGDNEITVSRFEDRVRVRGDELKATANRVCSDRKDRIILEGDVVLHYKKDGHCANVTGDRIELNLSSGAVTIKPAEKAVTRPAVRIDYSDSDTNNP